MPELSIRPPSSGTATKNQVSFEGVEEYSVLLRNLGEGEIKAFMALQLRKLFFYGFPKPIILRICSRLVISSTSLIDVVGLFKVAMLVMIVGNGGHGGRCGHVGHGGRCSGGSCGSCGSCGYVCSYVGHGGHGGLCSIWWSMVI